MTSDILIRLTPDVVAKLTDDELEELLAPLYPAVRTVAEAPMKPADKLNKAQSDLRKGLNSLNQLLAMADAKHPPK